MRPAIPLLMSVLLTLTACGDTRIERAGSGAVIGGVGGAAVGGICCRDPIDNFGKGAIIGAAIGALVGFLVNRPLFFDAHNDR